MKKLLFLVMLVSTSVSANYFKICSAQAEQICKELEGPDFRKCHLDMMQACVEDYLSSSNKSNPMCLKECQMVADEAARELCYSTCKEY